MEAEIQPTLHSASPDPGEGIQEEGDNLDDESSQRRSPFFFPPENVGHHLFLICIESSFELELASALTYNSRTAESPEANQWTDRGHNGSSGQEL